MVCSLCGVARHPQHDESVPHLERVLHVWDRYAASIAVRPPSERADTEDLPSMTDLELRASVERMPLGAEEKRALIRKATAGEYTARYVIAVRQECVRQLNALGMWVRAPLE
jgi:hypothetical protein